jgi:NAD(P)-dependent dehydrogenase (short-subunit alcohol dehydrogenase family)
MPDIISRTYSFCLRASRMTIELKTGLVCDQGLKQRLALDFFGGLRCIKAVVTSMRERRKGVIVNVTSVAGRVAMSPQAAYASSKWAFEALSEILAQELSSA